MATRREAFLGLNRAKPSSVYSISASSLGDGGFGSVFAARHKIGGQKRVLKVIEKRDRPFTSFRHDFDALLALDHPNVNRVFEFFEDRKQVSVAVEQVNGPPLGEVLTRLAERTESIEQWEAIVVKVVKQLLTALVYIHGKGVCHLDIKPENVIVTEPSAENNHVPHVVLIDFGIAAKIDEVCEPGSVPFLPPEHFSNNYERDTLAAPARDMWAIGCVLFRILSGGRFVIRCIYFRHNNHKTTTQIPVDFVHWVGCRVAVQCVCVCVLTYCVTNPLKILRLAVLTNVSHWRFYV
jgi:serine/threonine protein kinase